MGPAPPASRRRPSTLAPAPESGEARQRRDQLPGGGGAPGHAGRRDPDGGDRGGVGNVLGGLLSRLFSRVPPDAPSGPVPLASPAWTEAVPASWPGPEPGSGTGPAAPAGWAASPPQAPRKRPTMTASRRRRDSICPSLSVKAIRSGAQWQFKARCRTYFNVVLVECPAPGPVCLSYHPLTSSTSCHILSTSARILQEVVSALSTGRSGQLTVNGRNRCRRSPDFAVPAD